MTTLVIEGALDKLLCHYSSWFKLKRTICWMLRFRLYLYSKVSKATRVTLYSGPLRVCEMRDAELSIVKYVQYSAFADMLMHLKKEPYSEGFGLQLNGTLLKKLAPVLHNGLICVGGRLRNSRLPASSIHPIILPHKHPVTRCLIMHYHQIEGHMGTMHVLTSIRRRFWILKGAAAVRSVLHGCMTCKMRSYKPAEQIMADLPECRVTSGFPFAVTGVDCFGPFHIREGRINRKRYGCLFSCLKTRAVHIEVVYTLSIDSFLMALSRFINRRGLPEEMFSDQGSNFVGAELELKRFTKTLDDERLRKELVIKGIEWHFNPPYSSHRGGAWERMIRSIRRVLSAVSNGQVLTDESLSTFFSEVERVLNNRPITPVYDDPDQIDVLSPSRLLLLREPGVLFPDSINLRDRYTRHWRHAQSLADCFWRRWIKEYVPILHLRHKWMRVRRDFRKGDFVLLVGENMARGNWSKAVVVDAIQGTDGHVREVILRTTNGTIRRDVRRICLLEGVEDE